MEYTAYIPFWDKLTPAQQAAVSNAIEFRTDRYPPTGKTGTIKVKPPAMTVAILYYAVAMPSTRSTTPVI